jgi:protein CpxP
MNAKGIVVAVAALFLSVGAYAQSQPEASTGKHRLTLNERKAKRAEIKAKLAQMTPEERKAFKQAHHDRMQARLNAMTPEQRAKVLERRRQHKAQKDQEGK